MAYGGGFDMPGASQFAGGGFMVNNNQGNARGDTGFGGGGGGGGKRDAKNDTLRSLTIRHLLKEVENTDDERFTADGKDLSTLTIVGKVMSCREEATRAVLMINDGTATVEVMQWLNDDADTMGGRKQEWAQGRYVRVYGHLKSFHGKKNINAYAIKRIDDYNEVTTHFLKCVMEHLHLTRGAPPQPGMQPAMGGPKAAATGGYAAAPTQQHGAYGAAAPAGGGINDDMKHLFSTHEMALRPSGMTVDEALRLLQSMGRNYTIQQVMQAADYLSSEGHLYNTTDDRTFKTTGA